MQQAKAPSPLARLSDDDAETGASRSRAPRRTGLLTTGDMARLSNNTVRTVRFYEETGVLEPAHRSEGGHRLFPATELDKLIFVSTMRNAGLSLEEIKLLLGLKTTQGCGAEASRKVTEVLEQHIAAMTQKIAVLSRVRAEFQQAACALGACRGCNDDPRFPHRCGGCGAMQGSGVPLAVRVLWQVDEGEGQGQAGPADGAADPP